MCQFVPSVGDKNQESRRLLLEEHNLFAGPYFSLRFGFRLSSKRRNYVKDSVKELKLLRRGRVSQIFEKHHHLLKELVD